jgi:hypothetical protein
MKDFKEFISEAAPESWGGFGGLATAPSTKVLSPEDLPASEPPKLKPPVVEEDGEAAPGAAVGTPPVATLTTGITNYESPFGASWPTAKRRDNSNA